MLADIDTAAITNRTALATLPVTRKSQLHEFQKAAPPFGGLNATPPGRLAKVFVSPGPIYDVEGRGKDYWRTARAMFAAGFRAGDIVQNCFSYHLTPAGSMFETGLMALGCAVTKGSVEFKGERVDQLSPADLVKRGVLQVMEGRHCFAHLSVEENLLTGAYTRKARRMEISADLEKVYNYFPRLKQRRHTQAGYTSGGEQQMTALGRALMARPGMILISAFQAANAKVSRTPNTIGAANAGWLESHTKGNRRIVSGVSDPRPGCQSEVKRDNFTWLEEVPRFRPSAR